MTFISEFSYVRRRKNTGRDDDNRLQAFVWRRRRQTKERRKEKLYIIFRSCRAHRSTHFLDAMTDRLIWVQLSNIEPKTSK
jgi:septum formation topological specificity factor MinE